MRLFTLLFLLATALGAQDTDTTYRLPDATVTGFRDAGPSQRVAASVGMLSRADLTQYPTGDLLPAMNRLPGVRFEERAPGSYRISVRGSTLRSPFGVRNIKVYWNGIPFTEPGGDTQLNFLDLNNIDGAELLRGPSGSLYGAGTAGTLLLTTDTVSGPALDLSGGSYGFFRAGGAGAKFAGRRELWAPTGPPANRRLPRPQPTQPADGPAKLALGGRAPP